MSTLRKAIKRVRVVTDVALNSVGIRQSTSSVAKQAQSWWRQPPVHKHSIYSHFRDGFDDATWLNIGRESFDLFESFSKSMKFDRPAGRVVEWGCGGGANAVHFGREATEYIGIDVNEKTLAECGRQMELAGLTHFTPLLIDIPEPEAVLQKIPSPCDLFVCLYVFELFPSQSYGMRVLKIAHQLLRPGGMAMIQIKYSVNRATQSRGWGYKFGVANMTSYRIDEFWQHATGAGFLPHCVHLMPQQRTVSDERYAYFFLRKV